MENKVRQVYLISVMFFLLNLLWEVAHSLLYDWNKLPLQNDVYFYVPKILGATLGDFFILTFIFLGMSLINKNFSWLNKPSNLDYLLIVISGIIISIIIEIRGVYLLNRWSYNTYMPTIMGIGISPLIQLAVTSLLALFIVRKLE